MIYKDSCLNIRPILKQKGSFKSKQKYHKNIKDIVSSFEKLSIESNQKLIPVKKINSVSFFEKVKIHPLIKPKFIFYCRKPYMTELKDNFDPAIRTFQTINGYHFCSCSLCRIQDTICNSDKCEKCF